MRLILRRIIQESAKSRLKESMVLPTPSRVLCPTQRRIRGAIVHNPNRRLNILEPDLQDNSNMVRISENQISLMALSDDDILTLKAVRNEADEKEALNDTTIKVGDICVEQKPSVDGEELPNRFYKILGIVGKLHDIDINSYLVKEVFPTPNGDWSYTQEGTFRTTFSLSRSDCKYLNIEYQDGIEVYPFPSTDEFFHKYIKEDKEPIATEEKSSDIDYNNLATYPVSPIDGYIRHIVIQLSGFKPINNNVLLYNDGRTISVDRFCSTLRIVLKRHITSYDNRSAAFCKGSLMKCRIVGKTKESAEFNVADEDGNIFIEVDTFIKFLNSDKTSDGIVGISPEALNGLNVNDLFEITFNEGGAINNIGNRSHGHAQTMTSEREQEIWENLDRHFDKLNRQLEEGFKRYNDYYDTRIVRVVNGWDDLLESK